MPFIYILRVFLKVKVQNRNTFGGLLNSNNIFVLAKYQRTTPKIVSEYNQEIPQSQTADNPVAQRGRAAQPK